MKSRFVVPGAVVLALCAAGAGASSGDNVGAQVVVPHVVYDRGMSTTVFVRNHELTPLPLQLRYVGERSSAHPGYRRWCADVTVPAQNVLALDLRDPAVCGLGPNSDVGMLVLISLDKNVVGRLSASARIDVDGTTVPGRHSVMVDGLPLAALETTGVVHRATGLSAERFTGAGHLISTDCYVGSFFDGSRKGGMVGRLDLLDEAGQPFVPSQIFALRPFELLRIRDVFRPVSGSQQGVQAEVTFTGHGDAVLAYCTTEPESPDGRTFALRLAQVVESRDETKKRIAFADSTPGVHPPGTTFTLTAAAAVNRHGVYVRRPDVARCGVSSDSFLTLTAVSPDRSQTFNAGSSTGDFATLAQGTTGPNDLWGLEVAWADPRPFPPGGATYSITCRSGNGTSLTDSLLR